MPDSKAGSFATMNGQEFVNTQRTIAYIKNFGLPISVDADCWCPQIQALAGCDTPATGYSFPSQDPAPWYDNAIPESGDFLGMLVTEFDGLGSTFTRSTFDTLQGGAVLGRLRAQARTLTWRGFLFGRTCCAAEYGLRWLTAQLSGGAGCDGCDGSEIDILLCCPDVTGTVPTGGCDVTPVNDCITGLPIGTTPAIGSTMADDAFRTFFRAGLIDGPKILSQRTFGCGGDCDDGPGCLIEVEFSIVCGNPYMHKQQKLVCEKPFPACDTDCHPGNPLFVKTPTTTYPASSADAQACLNSLDCAATAPANCTTDPNCPTAVLPEIPEFIDPCGCEPIFTATVCCEISNDLYGQFFEGVPTIEITSGPTLPLRNVVLSFYENPQERTCTDTDLFISDCFKCAKMIIRYVPPNTTVTVDAVSKRVNAKCPGQEEQPAENLTVSPFKWPVLKCISYIVTVAADCAFPIDPASKVTISVTPREM